MAKQHGLQRLAGGVTAIGLTSTPSNNNGSSLRVEAPPREEDVVDSFFEVPAAVLCATCGEADCPGCTLASEHESGVVAVVPWERGGAVWPRLWATATATTQGAEAFFALLPDGEIDPAMRFALLAELLAVASMTTVLVPLAALALPGLALRLLETPDARATALRWVAVGVPALAAWMVGAHVTHGAALNARATREGARSQRRRAVRFGLYACGWDLMGGPLGALAMLVTRGLRDAADTASHAVRVRARATDAFLESIYELPKDRVVPARRAASLHVALLAVLTAAIVAVFAVASPRF